MFSNSIVTNQRTEVNINEILSRLENVSKTPKGWRASCPVKWNHKHGDRNPSLSIAIGKDNRILFYCFVGCQYEEIVRALGFEPHELNPHKHYRPLTLKEKEQARKQARERVLREALDKWVNESYLKLVTFRRALFQSLTEPDDYFKNPKYIQELLYVDHLLDILSSGSLEEKRELLNLYLEERLGIAGGWLS